MTELPIVDPYDDDSTDFSASRDEYETIERLIDAYEPGAGTAFATGYQGERGNPARFDRRYFEALRSLSGAGAAARVR